MLEQINPGLLQALPRSLTQLRAAEAILQHDLALTFNQCALPTANWFVIDVAARARLPEPLFRLGEWVRPYGFTPDVIAQCWHSIDPAGHVPDQTGQVFLAPAHRLLHDRGQLWLLPLTTLPSAPVTVSDWPDAPVALGTNGQLTVQVLERAAWDGRWPTNGHSALFDADALPFPWLLRPWREGDRFRPLGMTGSQLVSDLLADRKLPLPERQQVWVLESDGQIQWVVGLRTGRNGRITDKTCRIASVQWYLTAPRPDADR